MGDELVFDWQWPGAYRVEQLDFSRLFVSKQLGEGLYTVHVITRDGRMDWIVLSVHRLDWQPLDLDKELLMNIVRARYG
jgi:hypothetical protein